MVELLSITYVHRCLRKTIKYETNVPEAKHVTGYCGVVVVKLIIAHSSPCSVVIDLKPSSVVNSTSD